MYRFHQFNRNLTPILPPSLSFSQFQNKQYIDDENEEICCDTNIGLAEALRIQKLQNRLKGKVSLPRFSVALFQHDSENNSSNSNKSSKADVWNALVSMGFILMVVKSIAEGVQSNEDTSESAVHLLFAVAIFCFFGVLLWFESVERR
jgi:Holliday junction resolvasome RuvABC DNA-binding subunit